MAYTIVRSDGTQLTTIQDGTINTTSTSLGLPGRNYAGYGQTLNTNFVRQLENYASGTPPLNPLRGQLWYDTGTGSLNVCPTDGLSNPAGWVTLAAINVSGDTTLGVVNTTGDVNVGGDLHVDGAITGDSITVLTATVTEALTASQATISDGIIPVLSQTTTISTGSATTPGTITGTWTVVGDNTTGGNALSVISGNIAFAAHSVNGIKCDKYMNADGTDFNPTGTYTNIQVGDYLTGANSTQSFYAQRGANANLTVNKLTTNIIDGGGIVKGIWTLDSANGAKFEASYADLAERYAADGVYDVGTVVELGGENEITSVKQDASEEVFGIISKSYAYLLNSEAGTDETHPAVALAGRVPVKVIGEVRKGQRLVSAGNGLARGATRSELTAFNVIGRSLADKTDAGEGTVEAIVTIK